MGFSTGADKMLPPLPKAQTSNPDQIDGARKSGGGVMGLWGTMGIGAASVLAWLMVDLGGPVQLVSAMYSAKGQDLEWASLRQDVNRLNAERPNGANDQNQEVLTLRRRVAMLETQVAQRPAAPQNAIPPIAGTSNQPMGAPRSTASLPALNSSVQIPNRFAPLRDKVDLTPGPAKGGTRPPTHRTTEIKPDRMALATNSAKRSRLAPDIVFGLDLGAYDSIEVLKKRWQRVGGQHGDILGDLTPRRITEFSADGRIAHRLIAAPLADAVEVAKRCASLKARSVPCRQTLGIGEPL